MDERQLVAVPIAFVSKAFTLPAQKWTVTELELFAIIYSLKKLESLLILKSFVIETDHKNLVSLTEGTLGSSPRCTRWRHYIARFMYTIRHIPGARNIMADFFSRYVLPQDTQSPTTLAAITGSLTVDTDSEEKDMPILLPLGRQGADTSCYLRPFLNL